MRRIFLEPPIKANIIFLAVIFFIPVLLYSQEQTLASYQRNFVWADLPDKIGVLINAANDEKSNEFIGELYGFALKFITENGELLHDDPDMKELAVTVAKGLSRINRLASAPVLWDVLLIFEDSRTRVEILKSLAELGKGNRLITDNINRFVLDMNDDFLVNGNADYPVLQASISTLVSLGDNSSYPALFSTTNNFPLPYSRESSRAMDSIPGYLKMFLSDRIDTGPAKEKLTAYRIAEESTSLSQNDKGDLAETALTSAFSLTAQDEASISLRCDAIDTLSRLKRTRASSLAIRHYRLIVNEYKSGIVSRENLLGAMTCLMNMGDLESSQTLILELSNINAEVEKGRRYDEGFVVALIHTIGEMGDKTAYDNLLPVSRLQYSERVKAEARAAMTLLRW